MSFIIDLFIHKICIEIKLFSTYKDIHEKANNFCFKIYLLKFVTFDIYIYYTVIVD